MPRNSDEQAAATLLSVPTGGPIFTDYMDDDLES
jgi:hypothetical protein